jgi:hypothetical protein
MTSLPSAAAPPSSCLRSATASAAYADTRDEEAKEREHLVETSASIVWFAMDACWMLGLRSAATLLALPTVALAVLVLRFVPRTRSSWLVNAAVAAWTCMNTLWMLHDLKVMDWALPAGRGFLALGVVLVAAALLVDRKKAVQELVARLRPFAAPSHQEANAAPTPRGTGALAAGPAPGDRLRRAARASGRGASPPARRPSRTRSPGACGRSGRRLGAHRSGPGARSPNARNC